MFNTIEMTKQTKSEGFRGEKAIVTPYNIREMQAENVITKQLYITHIGYYPSARLHFRERKEGTPEHILIYCESGAGWIAFDGGRTNLQANQLFILPPEQSHTYGAEENNPWSIYWLHFRGENTAMFQSIVGKVLTAPIRAPIGPVDSIQLFEDMFKNLSMGYSRENLEYITFCLMYFLATFKYVPQHQLSAQTENEDVIQRCIHFMKANIDKPISLDDLASNVGYSTSHLNTLFVKGTAFSPIQYFNQLRVQQVCDYLQFTDFKIKQIAFKLGYYDPFHLSKAFIKEMGVSPKVYRAKYSVLYNDRSEDR